MQAWLAPSLRRFYPSSPVEVSPTLRLEAARGERVSFQVVFRTEARDECVQARVDAHDGLAPIVRRVGYVPVTHLSTKTPASDIEGLSYLPGYAPDPLLPEPTVHAGPFETNAFWVTLTVPADLPPDVYPVEVMLSSDAAEPVTLTTSVSVHDVVSPRRALPVTNWL